MCHSRFDRFEEDWEIYSTACDSGRLFKRDRPNTCPPLRSEDAKTPDQDRSARGSWHAKCPYSR